MLPYTGTTESDWYYYTIEDNDNSFGYKIRYNNKTNENGNDLEVKNNTYTKYYISSLGNFNNDAVSTTQPESFTPGGGGDEPTDLDESPTPAPTCQKNLNITEGANWCDFTNYPCIYFNNTYANYNKVSILLGRNYNFSDEGIGSEGLVLTKIQNTNLYFIKKEKWEHYQTFLFIQEDQWTGWRGEKVTSRLESASNYTDTYNVNMKDGGFHIFTPSCNEKGASLAYTKGSAKEFLHKTQTVQVMISMDGGATYMATTILPGTITATRYLMSGNNTVAQSEQTLSETTPSAAGVISSVITFNASAANEGYEFAGWGISNAGPTKTDAAYSYTIGDNATLYAYYKRTATITTYPVTITAGANGSVDPSGEQQIGEIPVTITATPHSGYQLDKWETSSSVAVKEQAGASITVTATATGTVKATFTEATPKLNIGAKSSDGSVCGEGEAWTIQPFTKVPNETGIYSTKITLKAGTFTFSIIGTDGKFYKNDGKMTRAFWGDFIFTNQDGVPDARIEADVEGTYEFRWDNTNKKLFVYYPLPDFYYYDDKGNWGGEDDATAQKLTKTETYAYLELDKTYLKNKDNNASNEFKIFDGNRKARDHWYDSENHVEEHKHTIACGSHIDNALGDITLTAESGEYTNAKYTNPDLSITGDKFYVLLYYPNTPVNSTGAYKLAASTTLPGTGGDYSVTILTNNASYGTVSPAGIQGINEGETLTITATPKKGYMLDTTNPWSATEGITVTTTEGNPNEATVSATQSGTVTANFVADPNFADNPCVALHGNFTGEWKSTLMEISPDGKTATYTLDITGTGNKNFGIKVLKDCNGPLEGESNQSAWMWGDKSNHNISRTTHTLTLIEQNAEKTNGADLSMLVDIAGEYTFTYEYATKTLTVAYPSKEIKPQQYLLYGNFDGTTWVQKKGEWKDNDNTGTWTLNLKKGAYMFKLLSVTAGSPSLNAQKGAATIQRENPDVMVDGEYSSNDRENITLNADEDGKYTVIFNYTTKNVHVTYPSGSKIKYRLVYAEKKPDGKYEKYHPSTPYINAVAEEATDERRDTVSLHVRCSIPDYHRNSLNQIDKINKYDPNPNNIYVYLQKWEGTKWETKDTVVLQGGNEARVKRESGVYNFVVVQAPQATDKKVYIDPNIEPYKGNYYIRTNVAPGGWNDYKKSENQITYSDYAAQHKHFEYYWCKWVEVKAEPSAVEGKVNLKFTIANDYSNCVSDTCADEMDNRDFTVNGRLGSNANVRWMWHSKTNDIDRAYIAGVTKTEANLFLVNKSGTINGATTGTFSFEDRMNWTYKIELTAKPNAQFAIIKKPHDGAGAQRYWVVGSETEGVTLIKGEGRDTYRMRIAYDFKSDHLIYAWVPDDTTDISDNIDLGAAVVCMRKDNGNATQVRITPETTTLSNVQEALGVLSLSKKEFFDKPKGWNTWEREYYWISFPFDVNVSDIFSTFVWDRDYIIQEYDGQSRADNGCWADSPTYWRSLSKTDKMEAGKGYVLYISHEAVSKNNVYGNNPSELNIYFPSTGVTKITGEIKSVEVPKHTCTDTRNNRDIYDSNWNLIGVPTWVNIEGMKDGEAPEQPDYKGVDNIITNADGKTVGFYYHFNTGTEKGKPGNTWTPRNVKEGEEQLVFKNMRSYLIQWAGTIDWSHKSWGEDNPSTQGLQARRAAEAKSEEYTLRLELSRGETALDQTFVRLQEDGDVTADYDMNYDMTKIINPGANLYSLIGTNLIKAGANVLPLPAENTTVYVPMGVVADKDGTYRFTMPDGTDGMLVSLTDHETGWIYNLTTGYCDVPLTKGTYEQRFVLEIQPKKGVTTGCNESTTDDGTLRKVLIDGNLYIQRGDALYDAAGRAL